jgi:predicted phage-related endonuclease
MGVNLTFDPTRLGASEAGDILGCGFRTPWEVAALHKGLIEPEPQNEDQMVGKLLERAIVEIYRHQTGHKVRFVDESVFHPDWPWLRYTVDAIAEDVPAVVEAKAVNEWAAREWGDIPDEMPLRVQLQCLIYMAATGLRQCHIAALIKGRPRIFEMAYDHGAANQICSIMESFWRRFIIGTEMPPLDTSAGAGRYLQKLFPTHREKDIVAASEAQAQLLDEYLTVRIQQKVIDETRAQLEVKLKQEVADHEGIEWQDGVFTWRKAKDGQTTNWQAMALGLMNQHIADPVARASITELYTRTKPGKRRVWLSSDQLKEAAAEVMP